MANPETCPIPEHPVLADVAIAFRDSRHWAWVLDSEWRLVYGTDDVRLTQAGNVEMVDAPIGRHYFGGEAVDARLSWRGGANTEELNREMLLNAGGLVLAGTPGGRDALRGLVHPALTDLVDGLEPNDREALTFAGGGSTFGGVQVQVFHTFSRVRDHQGRIVGYAHVMKPAVGMATLAAMTAFGDPDHFARMQSVARPGRRPAAVLLADLEGSSPLARKLSTAAYFALGRRLVRASDSCVIDAGGIVGRHVGDGVVAFFLAESLGSESAAARACIEASRALRRAMDGVAERSELPVDDVVMRFGLHWGSTLFVGNISTRGRAEVTALGDEVNEAARIEACATGGRALASKSLIERLDPADAAALGIDPDRTTYGALTDLDTATEKARRDAPSIAVCEV